MPYILPENSAPKFKEDVLAQMLMVNEQRTYVLPDIQDAENDSFELKVLLGNCELFTTFDWNSKSFHFNPKFTGIFEIQINITD